MLLLRHKCYQDIWWHCTAYLHWSWHWKYSDDGQSVALSPWGASSITRAHKCTMAGRTVASQRIKQGLDGLRTDCDQFWTHFCHIVLKVMILMVVSSTTTLFSFLLVDICFLSDVVMHPWSKLIMPIKTRKYISNIFFFTIGTTLIPIHAYTDRHAYVPQQELPLALLLLIWFIFNPSINSNYFHYEVWGKITYPFRNFNLMKFGNV